VRVHDLDATGGSSTKSVAGNSAAISITARGALHTGQIDVSGQNGSGGTAIPGSHVSLTAGGALTIGGDVYAGGGQSASGGAITVSGATVTAERLFANGGDGPYGSAAVAGGRGGTISVNGINGVSVGSIEAYGGRSYGGATPGSGGSITVTSPSGSIATGAVQSYGGATGEGPGAGGGPATLSAQGDLSVGGPLDTGGSDASGSAAAPWTGGNGGNVVLDAFTGALSLSGNASAAGGQGASSTSSYALGGTGGQGGRVVIVAHAIGTVASLFSRGGNGGESGATQGAGGPGGAIIAFTDAPLFNAHQLVSSDGGDGNPTGTAGSQSQDFAPSGLQIDPVTGALAFNSQSPDAQSYSVLMSVSGGAPTTVLQSSATSGLASCHAAVRPRRIHAGRGQQHLRLDLRPVGGGHV
jgi:hypothetical protein